MTIKKLLIGIHVIVSIVLISSLFTTQAPVVQASSLIQVSGVSDFEGITAGSGFELQGKSGLIALAKFVNEGSGVETSGVTFTLRGENNTGIIDFNNTGIVPIGHGTDSGTSFQGNFDGSGVIIENLTIVPFIDGTPKDGVGFFGRIEGALIENVTLSGVIVGSGFNMENVGGIVGRSVNSRIRSISILGSITLTGNNYIGGLAGRSDTEITESSLTISSLTISGNLALGGFVGNNRGIITDSYASIGILTISGTASNIGGFVGSNDSGGIITDSYASIGVLTLTGTNTVGGFVGIHLGEINSSYITSDTATITGSNDTDTNVGGFIGELFGDTSNSFAAINVLTVSGFEAVGGFIGNNYQFFPIFENNFLAIRELIFPTTGADINTFLGSGVGDPIPNNNFFNSGLTGNAWFKYDEETLSEIGTIDGTALLAIINGSDAFELQGGVGNFPVLRDLSGQTPTAIYWTLDTPPTPPDTGGTPPSPPALVYNDPSRGVPYVYDPVFLTITVDSIATEVGNPFTLSYRGFSTFGRIIKDYTSNVVVSGSVNPNVVGTYPITLTLTAEGLTLTRTFNVTVVDTSAPVVIGPAAVRLFVGQTYDPELTVTDNVDRSVVVTPLTTVDTSSAKVVDVVWQATDASGNKSTFTQRVEVVIPQTRVELVEVASQRFIFVVSEEEFNFDALRVEYVIGRTTPAANANWQVLSGSPTPNPGERVYVRLSDGVNQSPIRQTVARAEVTPIIETETESGLIDTTGWIAIGSTIVTVAALSSWWFLLGKKRRKDNEEEPKQ